MPVTFLFNDSKTVDNVAKSLIFVSKFSKKDAIIEFSREHVDIAWTDFSTYHIRSKFFAFNLFKRSGLNDDNCCVYMQANPATLGRTLKSGHSLDRRVNILYHHEEKKVKINVDYTDGAKRKITHSIPCSQKSSMEFKDRISVITQNVPVYDTISYINNIGQFNHLIERFVKLDTHKTYIWSKQGGDMTLTVKSQSCKVEVSLSDLSTNHDDTESDKVAGINIDVKKLFTFLSNLAIIKEHVSRLCFEIKHNQMMRVTFDSEFPNNGEKFHQSILLSHSLN